MWVRSGRYLILDSFPFDMPPGWPSAPWPAWPSPGASGCASRAEPPPPAGPVVLASRHDHHLLDALVLLTAMPRQAHFLVALDWVRGPAGGG